MNEQSEPGHGAPLEECDIVMKGGITSGVVYPSAVLRLSGRYRFRSIGGASVGAIAAAVTAAAEYGRQTGRGTGFAQLAEINGQLGRDGFLLSLFRPRASGRGLYAVYLAAIRKQGAASLLVAVLRQAVWVAVPLLAWWATLAVAIRALGEGWWVVPLLLVAWAAVFAVVAWALAGRLSTAGVLAGTALVLLWPLLLALPAVGLRGWRDLSRHGFGLVPGSSPDGSALCDWLHGHIQAAAGLDDEHPLTFGMLANDPGSTGAPVGIDLQMTTTNLSTARPMRLPGDLRTYAFHPDHLREVLPPGVLAWLESRGRRDGDLVRLPALEDLPVLLAFRMSLSFPGLFTAVRLYGPAPETADSRDVLHWFTDGGVASNFPVHFFDSWMPRRPTFALSFAPYPEDAEGRRADDEDVGLPPAPNGTRHARWVDIGDVGRFAGQLLDTMQNWRDTLQSELPGFRERVYETRLDKRAGEGGLNLAMDRATVQRLQERGARVGDAITASFDMEQHFFTRYLVTMQQLEVGLLGASRPETGVDRTGVREAFGPRRQAFQAGDVGAGELFGRDAAWLPAAGSATWQLVELAESWREFGRFFDESAPRPYPVKRIIPDV